MIGYKDWYLQTRVSEKIIEFSKDRSIVAGKPKFLKVGQRLNSSFIVKSYQDYVNFLSYNNILNSRLNIFNSLMDSYGGVDLFVDIDMPDHSYLDLGLESVKLVMSFFDKYRCPYHTRWSGCGFHVVVPYRFFSFKEDYTKKYSKILKMLKDNCSEMIDDKVNTVHAKIKTPFSLAIYRDKEYVCCPLDRSDVDNFKLDDYLPRVELLEKENYLFNGDKNDSEVEKQCRI